MIELELSGVLTLSLSTSTLSVTLTLETGGARKSAKEVSQPLLPAISRGQGGILEIKFMSTSPKNMTYTIEEANRWL